MVHISFFLPPFIGAGSERVVLNLAKSFVGRGLDVDVVVPDTTGRHQPFTATVPPQVRLIDLQTPLRRMVYLQKLYKLKQYLEINQPDILFANVDYVGVANVARAIAHCKTKLVQVVHSNLSQEFGKISDVGRHLKPVFMQHCYPWSDGLVAVSQGVAEDLAQLTGVPLEQIQVLYNPIVTSDLEAKAQEPVDHPWFAPGQPPVILGAGRLMYQKDFPTLIRAFAKVRQHRPCRLVILGSETYQRSELEALIQTLNLQADAQLLTFAANPFAYMAKASVFVLSSRYEGFGNVLVEAMATGTPVVSTDCKSGPAEILENGAYGRLVPVGDPNAMANAILDTFDRPTDPQILRQRAQYFAVEKIADQYLNYVDKILSQSVYSGLQVS